MNYPNLHLLLQAANRRELFVGLGRVVLLVFVILLGGLLLALATDAIFALPSWALIALDVALFGLACYGLFRLFRVLRAHRFEPRRVARLLESRTGMTNNSLINAIDLRNHSADGISKALLKRSVERGEDESRRINLTRAISTQPVRRASLWAGMLLCAALVAFAVLPDLFARGVPRLLDPRGDHPPFTLVTFDIQVTPEQPYHGHAVEILARLGGPEVPDRADLVIAHGTSRKPSRLPLISSDEQYELSLGQVHESFDFYIDTPGGRSDWQHVEVQQVPLFEDAWVRYVYPPHTGWPARRHPMRGRDIEAIVGTTITLEATSNLPLAVAHVTINSTQSAEDSLVKRLELSPQNEPRQVHGSFVLRHSGTLSMQLEGENGATSPEQREAKLIALPDRPPQVVITEPESMVLAVENWKIPVSVEASDDVRVEQLELNFAPNNDSTTAASLATERTNNRSVNGNFEIDLQQLQTRAGDEVRLLATSEDNRPDGPQSAHSDTHVIRVISMEEYEQYLREMYRMEDLHAEIRQLNEELEALAENRRAAVEAAEQLEQTLRERAGAGETIAAADRGPLDDAARQLELHAEQAEQLAEQLRKRLESPQLYDAEQLYREQLEQMANDLEDQAQRADDLQRITERVAQKGTAQLSDVDQMQDAIQSLKESAAAGDDAQTGLARNAEQSRQLMQAERMLSAANQLQDTMQQQRQLADRLHTIADRPNLTDSLQRRADQLAYQQERLQQQLSESVDALQRAAADSTELLPRTSSDALQLSSEIERLAIDQDQDRAARSARRGDGTAAHQAADQAADKLESLASSCPTAQGMAQELDAGLGLSRQGLEQTMKQLEQRSSTPSLGSNSSRQSARGSSTHGTAEFGLRGPLPPSSAMRRRGGRMTANGLADGSEPSYDAAVRPEIIQAADRDKSSAAKGLQGVPVGYRDQAEAYFRRLAEEQ